MANNNNMKKYIILLFAIFIYTSSFAKKVKFSVDMDTVTINTTGVHVMGDFQILLGCTTDFDAACTPLTQEFSTTIYSTIVDIPAFAKYEYAFVNGDQGYEVENVPWESQVGFVSSILNTNRWIYIDSLADDTTDIGAIIFSRNAPAGLTLIRFKVDMHEEASVSPNGVHTAGVFSGWNTALNYMWSFNTGMYEVINYLTAGTYEYKYYNGNTTGDAETVPGPCSVFGNREIVLSVDTIMHDYVTGYPVCFGGCAACVTAGFEENNSSAAINIYPNPANNKFTIHDLRFTISRIEILDVLGSCVIQSQISNLKSQISVDISSLSPGIYFVCVSDADNSHLSTSKLVIE